MKANSPTYYGTRYVAVCNLLRLIDAVTLGRTLGRGMKEPVSIMGFIKRHRQRGTKN